MGTGWSLVSLLLRRIVPNWCSALAAPLVLLLLLPALADASCSSSRRSVLRRLLLRLLMLGTWLVALRHPVHLHASLHGVQGGGRGLAEDDDIALQSTSCRWSLVCRARQLSWLCADLGRAPQSTSSIQVLSKAQASSSNCAQCLFQQGPSKAQAQAQAQASSSKASSSKAQHRCFG